MPNIYKYYQFEQSTYWELPISKGEIYFSSFDKFNDPFELHFKTSVTADFNLRLAALIESNPNNERIKSFKTQEEIESFVGWMGNSTSSQTGHREKMNMLGISCFSEVGDEILMWAHYSKGLSGICLEFDPNLIEDKTSNPQLILKKVKYSNDLPTFNFFTDKEFVLDFLANKAMCWSYEKEIRAFKAGLQNLKFDAKALRRIIVGANSLKSGKELWELEHFQRLFNLLDIFRPDLKDQIYIAKPKLDEYKIVIEKMNL